MLGKNIYEKGVGVLTTKGFKNIERIKEEDQLILTDAYGDYIMTSNNLFAETVEDVEIVFDGKQSLGFARTNFILGEPRTVEQYFHLLKPDESLFFLTSINGYSSLSTMGYKAEELVEYILNNLSKHKEFESRHFNELLRDGGSKGRRMLYHNILGGSLDSDFTLDFETKKSAKLFRTAMILEGVATEYYLNKDVTEKNRLEHFVTNADGTYKLVKPTFKKRKTGYKLTPVKSMKTLLYPVIDSKDMFITRV